MDDQLVGRLEYVLIVKGEERLLGSGRCLRVDGLNLRLNGAKHTGAPLPPIPVFFRIAGLTIINFARQEYLMLPSRLYVFCGEGPLPMTLRGEGRLLGHREIAFLHGQPVLRQNIRIGFAGFAQVGLECTFAVWLGVQRQVELLLPLLHCLLRSLFYLTGAVFHI